MQKTNIPNTDLQISRLGLGTVKFGRNQGVKYPDSFELPTDDHLADLLTLAKDLGINLLDTAPAYGTSEERLGHLLKGQRNDWVIVGKVGEEFEDGQSTYIFTPDHFKYSFERSLKRLQTDHLDALLIHCDANEINTLDDDAPIQTMYDFKSQGLVKAIGASTRTVKGGIKTLELMDIAMVAYNPDYQDEKPVLDYAAANNKAVLLKKILGSGHTKTPTESIRFALDHPGTTAAIIGTITPENLKSNVNALKKD